MRDVSIVGVGMVPVQKSAEPSLAQLGAVALHLALADAGVERPDAVYVGNMLSDELQSQKHVAALVVDAAGLQGIEALLVRAATAAGAAALRMAYLAVASGQVDVAVALGVEKMSEGAATPALAKALDARSERAEGATLLSKNAELMQRYLRQYNVPDDGLVNFAVNAHANASHNEMALFRKPVTAETVAQSRLVQPPLRLFDCAPICDGSAAVVLAPRSQSGNFSRPPVHLVGSSVATDRFRIQDRPRPLQIAAATRSAAAALEQGRVTLAEVSLFEAHDAFSIMACLLLEAVGFAEPGQGWRLAAEGEIGASGRIPVSTMGGLKARGHPIGATALYQTAEIVLQLTQRAGATQVPGARVALMQSVGGAATTVLTHVFTV